MEQSFFVTVFYEPLYNGLLFLVSILPGADVGFAVILFTLFVKFVLLPLSYKASLLQHKSRLIEPDLKKIKEQYKDDKETQARKMFELYQKEKVNPFSGCFILLLQLPIIIALYWTFWKGLRVDETLASTLPYLEGYINTGLLDTSLHYSFITVPEFIKVDFLGFIDMTHKSVLLALLAGITQFIQMKIALPDEKFSLESTGNFQDDFAKSMRMQMKYILPVIVTFFAYSISAAIALYWTISNLFAIVQEYYVRAKVTLNGAK